ncbi:MAG: hypothetical protein ACI81R_001976 [Bradymonadia bacterium]|jgi:hypothetical protein
MAIKPTGPKLPTTGVDRVSESIDTKPKVGAEFTTSAPTGVGRGDTAQAPEVVAAAKHVAGELNAGRLDRVDAPDAAIEHIVRAQSAGGPERALRAKIEAAQLMLGDDPHFVRALSTLIDNV